MTCSQKYGIRNHLSDHPADQKSVVELGQIRDFPFYNRDDVASCLIATAATQGDNCFSSNMDFQKETVKGGTTL
jgi:hypothetical protein